MADLDGVCEATNVDIIRAIDEDHVNTAHACNKRDNAPGHDLVLAEQTFVPNVAAGQSEADDDDGENGAPP